jgi:hypothetical protein
MIQALLGLLLWTHFQILGVPALAILTLLIVALSFGLGGLVEMLGARLLAERPGPRRTIAATLALSWACNLPFIGWFGPLPLTAARGLGAFMSTFFTQPARPQ